MSVSLIYLGGLGAENVGGGQSWVRGIVLELDGGRLSWGCSEDEGVEVKKRSYYYIRS